MRDSVLFSSLLLLAALTTQVAGQRVLFSTNGDGRKHLFGGSVGRAGDVDKDGYVDFVAGAPNPDGIGRVRVHSGRDGRVLYRFIGEQVGGFFGVCAKRAGDVNADGHSDIIVGASSYSKRAGKKEGMVKVYSGKDGTTLHTVFGFEHDSEFGFSTDCAGDLDKDGHDDFIVGAFREDGGVWDSGCVRVFSGKDATVIHSFRGSSQFTSFGLAVAGLGDLNHDGYPDIAVGAPRDDVDRKTNSGSVSVYSGKDGALLFSNGGDLKNDEYGFAVSAAGDINKDGTPDLIVGVPREDHGVEDCGGARVLSGMDGSTLYSLRGDAADDWFGWAVSAKGDLDNDGYPDFVVGAFFADIRGVDSGTVYVYSGQDGSLLYRMYGNRAGDWYGQSLAMLGDINRDGHDDFAIGAEREDHHLAGDSGTVYVISGKSLTLWSDTHALTLKGAGRQNLSIDCGAAHAGRSYWIFGSATGTHPGTTIAGLPILLVPDTYTRVLMKHTNTPSFTNFRGNLDSTGKASAQINVPGGLSGYAPFTLYHDAVIFDNASGNLYFATNPISLRLNL